MYGRVAIALLLLSWGAGRAAAQSGDATLEVAALGDYFASPDTDGSVQAPFLDGSAICEDAASCFNACRFPGHYVQADALYWHRVGAGCSQTLVVDTDNGSSLLATDDLDFGLAPGFRFLVGWQPGGCSRCCAWELSYFGIYNWNADAVVTGGGDLAIPGDLGLASNNFFLADEISLNYRSELHNAEFNCVKSCCLDCTRLDFLAGFRYVGLNDSLSLTALDLQEGTSSYDVDVHNDLYGFQLGGRLTRPLCCRWGLELTGKAGLFYNDAQQRQIVTDFPDQTTQFILRDSRGSGDGVAMLGEIGVVLLRPINDCWTLRVGYNALGIGGLALAPDQLDFTDTPISGTDIHNEGWIFAHGGLVGLERRW